MTMDNPPDTEIDVEEYLEDTSIKALLVEQNALLRGIYDRLGQERADNEGGYLCQECNTRLSDSDVEQHMKEQHNAPPGIDYLSTPFIERV
jgi:hypothetical protein